jgi:hypothetical protein
VAKDSRIAVRLTSEQDELIRRTAEAEGTSPTSPSRRRWLMREMFSLTGGYFFSTMPRGRSSWQCWTVRYRINRDWKSCWHTRQFLTPSERVQQTATDP